MDPLPRPSPSVLRTPHASRVFRFSPLLVEAARLDRDEVFRRLATAPEGLSDAEAERRRAEAGPNVVATRQHRGRWWRLLAAARNPLVVLLGVLAAISFATGDARAGGVMTLMVCLGVLLRFVQEARAGAAAERLEAMIRVTATVLRGGVERELPLRELVPGDVVQLAAGDMVPADARLVAARDLFVSQGALTGESLPSEKHDVAEPPDRSAPLEFENTCFLGTSVESGAATAVIVATGERTCFGGMASSLSGDAEPTAFDRGVQSFTWLMIRLMAVMVPLVFVINGLTKHDWRQAFFFTIAVAVGLTPEMLPMIVSVCLAKGALAMSRQRVVVKQLAAIQNFGAMDMLCTDKTGTLTMDRVVLERHCDVAGRDSAAVLLDAYLIAHFQTGLRNVLDRAVLAHRDTHAGLVVDHAKIDEIPFDFVRRMMSVAVREPGGEHRLLTKGAPEAVFARCGYYECDGTIAPLAAGDAARLALAHERLSAEGFRVLAVAWKRLDPGARVSRDDERDLVLEGYVAFLDPPKESAGKAIGALRSHGITVKVLTGDNDLVTANVCRQVGLDASRILTGSRVEAMQDAELDAAVRDTHVFARLSPADKQRIIRALQNAGHVVGFLGDGINDAPALHVADVGISVDSAVDIAKAAASVILLEKDLMVLDDGVVEGRKVFVNILKYVRMGASSNFGNMFSVLAASAFLPFIPMAPIQVLTNNLLYDFSQVPIPTDNVGADQTDRPRPWNIGDIRRFVLCIGPVSSIFDITTFLAMFFVFGWRDAAHAPLFQTGWFVESLMTQTLIVHVIRTRRLPFIESRASWQLTSTTLAVMAIGAWLPYSPLAPALGFQALPAAWWLLLLGTLVLYVAVTQWVKTRLATAT